MLEGAVNGVALDPRLSAPINFTVKRRPGRPMPSLSFLTQALVALNRLFGVIAFTGGVCLLAKCGYHLLQGTRSWSQSYFAVFFGVAMVLVSIVYLRARSWRRRREVGGEASSHDH